MTTSPPTPLRDGGGGDGTRGRFSRGPGMILRARALRGDPTEAEKRLWSRLRRDALGVRFRRQVVVGQTYIVDFLAPAAKLVVEADGGQHTTRTAEDATRTAFLNDRGLHVLRFWNDEILRRTDDVIAAIVATLAWLARTDPISPPSPAGRGDGGEALSHLNLSLATRS